ncbi:FAD-binding monooxygenase [Gryllotalpicola ginsengisoli]|uniref:FAD-binding monooxygenase n=1 Tax=Gryllotalpicola ginsengisoli TaxID=444608 RepID=UPI0003B6C903|nr:FAD-binding monooxygenase [Gryllotalpicola ginsengisoli]
MQFHHYGYVSGDPRVQPAAGIGLNRPDELPDEMDVLIVGTGPAGVITAAQLAQFPDVNMRIIDRRPGRLEVGQADGIQARSVETFQAFGFANRIIEEAYRITEMVFWRPDPEHPENIVRSARTLDDETGISEFPHLIVNQARVLDYFLESMASSPTRAKPDYGWEFLSLEVTEGEEYPVAVTLRRTAGPDEGRERVVRAKYVVGADGAKSRVRQAIGRRLEGSQAFHAWGVMDVLADTDFPDIRTKAAIQSHDGGSILHIPREGNFLFRMYVDLGEVPPDDNGAIRHTPQEVVEARANQILHPYTLTVKHVAWRSVYEVGHRVTDRFDDVSEAEVGTRSPRVFILGDACHTHSAKAGQGMNVSMQDGFNLAWKLGHVLEGRAPEALLDTFSAERHEVAVDLIEFDRQWSTLMAAKPEELDDPDAVEAFYVKTFEFPAGFMTQYKPSLITGEPAHQALAAGFPIGKRFKSHRVTRVCDANIVHLGHHHRADGRWRIYVFADAPAAGEPSRTAEFAEWITTSPDSPVVAYTPAGADVDAWFDVKVIYQQDHTAVEMNRVPAAFLPKVGPYQVVDYEKVYSARPGEDIFDGRGISRDGAIVVVRPDQYVANVLPLTDTAGLSAFFARFMSTARAAAQPATV